MEKMYGNCLHGESRDRIAAFNNAFVTVRTNGDRLILSGKDEK